MSLPCNDDCDFESNSFFCLQLVTVASTVIRIDVPVSIHHTWEMLEAYLVEHLPFVSHLDIFGCELTLLDVDTHQALQDPIQEDLWWNTQFHLVVQECFQKYDCKEQLQGEEYEDYPKAICVVAIEYAAFQGCYTLVMVEMPGCVELEVRLFSAVPLKKEPAVGYRSRSWAVCV